MSTRKKQPPNAGPNWRLCALASLALGLTGCATHVPPAEVKANARLTPATEITRDLMRLPRPKARIPVAVYGFRDQTGQYRNDSAYSTLVTQGAATMLVKALADSGWFVPVEREGLQNLLTERRIIRAIESPTDKGKPITNLPNMMPASMIIEGGVIAYESNVRTGGKGANYLGIGASTQYRVDQVTVGLRSVDVRFGQILNTVSVTKTIYSHQFNSSIYRFVAYQKLLQAESGYTSNEPSQLAVREAIEAAVIHLTVSGIRDRNLELEDPGQWFSPLVQAYVADAMDNHSPDLLANLEQVPMMPVQPARAPVVPLPFLDDVDPLPARPRPVAPAQPANGRPPAAPPSLPSSVPAPSVAPTAAPAPSPATAPAPSPAAVPAAVPAAAPKPAATLPAVAPTLAQAPAASSRAPLAPAGPSGRAVQAAMVAPLPAQPTAAASTAPGRSVPPAPAVATPPAPRASEANGSPALAAPGKPDDIFNLYWKSR